MALLWSVACSFVFRAASAEPVPLTPAAVEAFADEVVTEQLAQARVPGAVFVVVHRSRVLLSKGFGFADLEAKKPVDAQTTVFRVGSVSKVVTAAAIMKLARLGKLDLGEDVRKKLSLATRFDEPITIRHLLTHSSGFDVSDIGDAALSADGRISLAEFVARRPVDQIAPPGTLFRYTNHGYAWLGRLAELAAGKTFEELTREHVFSPLGMASSTFEQPAPDGIAGRMAIGYELAAGTNGAYERLPLDFSNVAPADALVTTGADMAAFMLALFGPELAPMHETHFSHHPALPGRSLGFAEQLVGASREQLGPRRLLSHTGGQLGFSSEILIDPREELGLFIVQNLRRWEPRYAIFEQFLQRFRPEPASVPKWDTTPQELDDVAGHFQKLPMPSSTLEGVGSLLEPVTVSVAVSSGTDVLVGGRTLQAIAPLAFASADGKTTLAFARSADGVEHMFLDSEPYERTRWYSSHRTHRGVLLAATFYFAILAVAWPLARWWRRRRGHEESEAERWIGRLVVILALLQVGFVVAFMALLISAFSTGGFDYGLPGSLVAVLWLPVVTAALTAVLAAVAVRGWVTRRHGWWLTTSLSVTVCVSISALCVLGRWNLIGG